MRETQKILLCSNDNKFIDLVENCLPKDKYQLIILRKISELISKVYDKMPHLIIADLHLSDIGSFDACNQMKSDMVLGHIPLFVFSNSPKMGKQINCGADLYLHKPIQEDEFLYHVERIIRESVHELDINPLTDLPGNHSTVRKIESVLGTDGTFAVCYLDLKNLHIYNQAYGVHRGDFLIRETSGIIKGIVARYAPKDTYVGHLGGDDFVILASVNVATNLSQRITEAFDSSVHKFYERVDRERGYMLAVGEDGKYEHYSFASMSVAIITNELIAYEHVADLTKTASQIQRYLKRFPMSAYLIDRRRDMRDAVYGIGKTKMNPAIVSEITGDKNGNKTSNHEVLAALDYTLKSGRVDVFLQPMVQMKNKRIFGYEALSWFPKAADAGNYWDPTTMFAAARSVNLTKELDILCACNALDNARGMPSKEKIFINLNRETLIDPGCLKELLRRCPVKTSQIVIEMTEQSVLKELDKVCESIKFLRSKGTKFAIDDMGGGAVSLREVTILQPDFIKFDGSLIRDIDKNENKQKILLSLLVFAKSLKAETTAEGIETKAEMGYLQKTGVDFGQGYYIAKPWRTSFTSKEKTINPTTNKSVIQP